MALSGLPSGGIRKINGVQSVGSEVTLTSTDGTIEIVPNDSTKTIDLSVDITRFDYITNPDAEVGTDGWNLYNNAGRTVSAFLVNQDLTYTSTLSGDAGNGVQIEYVYNAGFPSSTPNINVISSTHVQVRWSNGPTVANNPTATQLKTAWDTVPAALAVATISITGTSTKLQYITGSSFLEMGGDTSPIDGTGGTVTGVTLTRNTATPLVGIASFDLSKDSASREGTGVSTDFEISNLDKGQILQVSFAYEGMSGIVLGSSSDVRVFLYDIVNAVLIPIKPLTTLPGPTGVAKTFTGTFQTVSSSVAYRLILHIATTNTAAWDLLLDSVTVDDTIDPEEPTQVESVVLVDQAISGAVTDHMAVAWTDGANAWVPATSAYNGDEEVMLGFATNIVGLTAEIFVSGFMDGFSFGPFSGYNQYVDPAIPGQLTPLPSPFTDTYVIMGKAISATAINIQVSKGIDLVGVKGGLLSNTGLNNGAGDTVLSVGTNGSVLTANSAVSLGLQWGAAVVTANPFSYTTATRTLDLVSQTQNKVLASPSGATGTPTFRAVVATDIPTLNQNTTGSAASFTGALAGNVTGTQSTTVVATVGGSTAANIHTAELLANAATSTDTANTVVKRDAAGAFEATKVTGATSAGTLTLNGGTAASGGAGGVVAVAGADGSAVTTGGNGGAASLKGGQANGDDTVTKTGGAVTITSGSSKGSGLGADISLTSGNGGVGTSTLGAVGGNVNLTAGNGGLGSATGGAGGALKFNGGLGGNSTAPGAGGAVIFQTAATTALAEHLRIKPTGEIVVTAAPVQVVTAGFGLQVKSGSNCKLGTATLVAGAVTVSNTTVTANSLIFMDIQVPGGTIGSLRISAKVAGTSFTITSTNVLDTSTIAWMIVEAL